MQRAVRTTRRRGAEVIKMKKLTICAIAILLLLSAKITSAKEVEIWFVASVEVGIERFIDSNERGKTWSNRPHYVELTDT